MRMHIHTYMHTHIHTHSHTQDLIKDPEGLHLTLSLDFDLPAPLQTHTWVLLTHHHCPTFPTSKLMKYLNITITSFMLVASIFKNLYVAFNAEFGDLFSASQNYYRSTQCAETNWGCLEFVCHAMM
jgi:hypothetical protein